MDFDSSFTATITPPFHVHLRKGGAEAVFDVDGEVALRESQGFKLKELSRAQELAEENRAIIIAKWHEHIG
jgi:hypothetical protein